MDVLGRQVTHLSHSRGRSTLRTAAQELGPCTMAYPTAFRVAETRDEHLLLGHSGDHRGLWDALHNEGMDTWDPRYAACLGDDGHGRLVCEERAIKGLWAWGTLRGAAECQLQEAALCSQPTYGQNN